MKFIYISTEKSTRLSEYGLENCYLGKSSILEDKIVFTSVKHRHNEYEAHFITQGAQIYEFEKQKITVSEGELLLIPPYSPHKGVSFAPHTQKYSLSFQYDTKVDKLSVPNNKPYIHIKTPEILTNGLAFIEKEGKNNSVTSSLLIENRVFEMLISLLRLLGMKENAKNSAPVIPFTLMLAKRYIVDNIQTAPTAKVVAAYCHLSEKQLSRIFIKYEGVSIGNYIRTQRLECMKTRLCESRLSIKELSEEMHFSSEYYFNIFFKKHYGMSPGAYRKMMREK